MSAESALALALALSTESAGGELPESGAAWLDAVRDPGEHLVVLDEGAQLAAATDIEGWRDFLVHLDQHWLAPLLSALRSRTIASLSLQAQSASTYRLTRYGRFRWWRRHHDFGHYVERFQLRCAETT